MKKKYDKTRELHQEEIRQLQGEVAELEKGCKRQRIHRFQRNVLLEEKELLE